MEAKSSLFCYLHFGGKIERDIIGKVEFSRGRRELISIEDEINYDDFVSMVCSKLNVHCHQSKFKYALAHGLFSFLPLAC